MTHLKAGMTLTTEDLLPEFEHSPTLIDGERYVLIKRPQSAADSIELTSIHPRYAGATDSWHFPSGDERNRNERDLWIPLADYPGAVDRAWDRNRLRTYGLFFA